MNHIERLIEEMCPDGVPFIPVSKAFIQPKVPKGLRRSQYEASGPYPIIDQGRKEICGYTRRGDHLISDGPHIIFGDHTRSIKYTPKTYALGADGTKVLSPRNGIEPRFAFHYLKSLKITDRGYNRHWPILKEMPFPIPPVEVQREIVEILDKFSKLEAELEAELEARMVQLEAIRNYLMDIDCPAGKTLGSALSMKAGTFVSARKISPVMQPETPIPCYGANGLRGYVESATHDGRFILIGRQGALSGNVRLIEGAFCATEHAIVCAPIDEASLDLVWAYHYLVASELNQYVSKGAQPGLAVKNLLRLALCIPDMQTQIRIGEMLHSLEGLVEGAGNGLPAEITARRQQYEYYRDRLLTFKELQ